MKPTPDSKRLAILISGRGSNMLALVEAIQASGLPVVPVLVVSNRPEAAGLARAQALGIPTLSLDHRGFPSREAFDLALADALDAAQPDLIVLAGFMRILTPGFCERFAGRLLNIHPALLPAYPGLDTHARALADGALIHGATVHAVTAGLDQGPSLAQAIVPVKPDDTPQSLADRVLLMEHRLYPQAVLAVLSGLVRWNGQGWTTGTAAPGFESLTLQRLLFHPDLAPHVQ